jgi:hypothetical protein
VLIHWSQSGDELGALIPKFSKAGPLTKPQTRGDIFPCPQAWQTEMLEAFERLAQSAGAQHSDHNVKLVIQSWRDLNILDSTSAEPSTLKGIAKHLHKLLEAALRSPSLQQQWTSLAAGKGFLSYVRITGKMGNCDKNLWPLLCASSPCYANRAKFLEALLTYISNYPQ